MSTPAPEFYHDIKPGPVDMAKFLSQPRQYHGGPVVAGHVNRNSALIADVARLYIPYQAKVLDMTWGKGSFWTGVFTLGEFDLYANDIVFELSTTPDNYFNDDFRHTRFRPETFDIVVLDPPYKSGGGHSPGPMVDTYGLDAIKSTTPSKHGNASVVWSLYEDGMLEAFRILKPGGLLWVKCQDFVESGKQHWFHIESLPARQHLRVHTQGSVRANPGSGSDDAAQDPASREEERVVPVGTGEAVVGYVGTPIDLGPLEEALFRKNTLKFDRPNSVPKDIWDRAVAELMNECPPAPGLYDDVVSDNRPGINVLGLENW